MTKTEMLFIRACKSRNPDTRVESVYRRFYYSGNARANRDALISILANICDNYLDASISRIINDLAPNKMFRDPLPFEERAYYALINWIRLSPVDVFDDYIPPAKFRNQT